MFIKSQLQFTFELHRIFTCASTHAVWRDMKSTVTRFCHPADKSSQPSSSPNMVSETHPPPPTTTISVTQSHSPIPPTAFFSYTVSDTPCDGDADSDSIRAPSSRLSLTVIPHYTCGSCNSESFSWMLPVEKLCTGKWTTLRSPMEKLLCLSYLQSFCYWVCFGVH